MKSIKNHNAKRDLKDQAFQANVVSSIAKNIMENRDNFDANLKFSITRFSHPRTKSYTISVVRENDRSVGETYNGYGQICTVLAIVD